MVFEQLIRLAECAYQLHLECLSAAMPGPRADFSDVLEDFLGDWDLDMVDVAHRLGDLSSEWLVLDNIYRE
ncbi:MAG: hypothetical protein V4505_04135 [Pseudomonadota bacterium]